MTYFFIGFKNATDCIASYRITHNNLDIGESSVATAQIESFLFNVMQPKCEKENKRNTHTLWEEAHKHNPSICGKYFSLWELYQASLTSRKLRVQFPVIIGFDDILPFQNFTLFPSSVFGDLALVIRVSPDALVWCSCDPHFTIVEQVELREFEAANPYALNTSNGVYDYKKIGESIRLVDTQFNYDKRFTQLNTRGRAATNVVSRNYDLTLDQLACYSGADITIRADKIITWEANSIICGFALDAAYKEDLKRKYEQQPFIIPSEVVRIYNFSTAPNGSGLNCVMTVPMINVKEVCVLFPRYASDLTVFFNPCLSGLQINMLNRQWPDQSADTTTAEFFRLQLEVANLDSLLPCTESFESSFVSIPTYKYPIRDRSKSDNTDFVLTLPTERSNANAFFFDGVFSQNETITLRGNLLTLTETDGTQNVVDTYYILKRNGDRPTGQADTIFNRTAPILCLVSDSFFMFSTGKRATYETTLSWNETFAKYYPQLYQSLVSAVVRG
jgi:hypothetical protein